MRSTANATDSDAEDRAATSKAVKIAMDNAKRTSCEKIATAATFPINRCLLKTSD
ncbi:tail fiber protein [Escherichia coli]|uniref:tail fiber protein n=1 Tax=Escherichia coli TaxID=562 RepID=UPI003B28BA8F